MASPLLSEEERDFDACVLGTGLVECLVASALSQHGFRVLHIDSRDHYGGVDASLTLDQIREWCNDDGEQQQQSVQVAETSSCFDMRGYAEGFSIVDSDMESNSSLPSGQFSVDLLPRLVLGKCSLVELLLRSGTARYVEFRDISGVYCCEADNWIKVPFSKGQIFESSHLNLLEKRSLMKFLTSLQMTRKSRQFVSARTVQGSSFVEKLEPHDCSTKEETWREYLQRMGLNERTQNFVIYGVCLCERGQSQLNNSKSNPCWSVQEGLERLGVLAESIGIFSSKSSFLYTVYGTGELAQSFTRVCALHKGTYMLRVSVQDLNFNTVGGRLESLTLTNGQEIKTRVLVSSAEYLKSHNSDQEEKAATNTNDSMAVMHVKVVLRLPLFLEKKCAETDQIQGKSSHVKVGCLPPENETANPIFVLQTDFSCGTCSRDSYLVHFHQMVTTPTSSIDEEIDDYEFPLFLDENLKSRKKERGKTFKTVPIHLRKLIRRVGLLVEDRQCVFLVYYRQTGLRKATVKKGKGLIFAADPPLESVLSLLGVPEEAATLVRMALEILQQVKVKEQHDDDDDDMAISPDIAILQPKSRQNTHNQSRQVAEEEAIPSFPE